MVRQMMAQFSVSGGAESLSEEHLLMWGGILILIVLAGFFVIMAVRRRFAESGRHAAQDPGFSLSSLRELRDRGELTPEEYDRMRARVIAKVKGQAPPREPEPENDAPSPGDEK